MNGKVPKEVNYFLHNIIMLLCALRRYDALGQSREEGWAAQENSTQCVFDLWKNLSFRALYDLQEKLRIWNFKSMLHLREINEEWLQQLLLSEIQNSEF